MKIKKSHVFKAANLTIGILIVLASIQYISYAVPAGLAIIGCWQIGVWVSYFVSYLDRQVDDQEQIEKDNESNKGS